MASLLNNIGKLHTTELDSERIKQNLSLSTENVVEWCKTKIMMSDAQIIQTGKN